MLQSLDTLIAFVVIMTITSLLVTILVQMVSAALSLRGKNLANALALTFQTIDPSLAASAHQLAAKILSDPLLSDSTRTSKDRNQHDTPVRGTPWHVLTFGEKAITLATAVRPGEVYDVLRKLAAGDERASQETQSAINALADARAALAGLPAEADRTGARALVTTTEASVERCKQADRDRFNIELTAKRNQVLLLRKKVAESTGDGKEVALVDLKTAEDALDALCRGTLPGAARMLLASLGAPADHVGVLGDKLAAFDQLKGEIPAALKDRFEQALQDTSVQLVHLIDSERQKFDDWFDSAQNRAQQWFQLHTRVVTIFASVLIALLLQLDVVEVFHHVSTNTAARSALVASADKVVQQSDGILEEKSRLIARINQAWGKESDRLNQEGLEGVRNTEQLEQKLSAKALPAGSFDKVAFNDLVERTANAYYKEQQGKIADLTRAVSATGFELIPATGWRWPAYVPSEEASGNGPSLSHCQSFRNVGSHLFGIIFFAALLTLGAPYWFNLLKNLSSLRPALAQLIGKEEAAAPPPKK